MKSALSPEWALLAVPEDAQYLAKANACACGHASLAAALRCNVSKILPAFHCQGPGLWVNAHRMACALTLRTGKHLFVPLAQAWTTPGPNLLWIQGLGSWMKEGLPAARNKRTHWVTTINVEGNSWVYDINNGHYLPKPIWEKHVLAAILDHWKATGWQIRTALTPPNPAASSPDPAE